jgi:2-keto-4-pentenoate hydratase/2-oxohepta-3-ene-1,7-dioic acid hydratase in catechol pathway
MRLCRFDDNRVGVVLGDEVLDVTEAVMAELPALRWPLPLGDLLIAQLNELRPRIEQVQRAAPRRTLAEVKLLSPVANAAHIIAAPLNYKLHIEESVNPEINHGVHMPGFEGYATPIHKMGVFLKSQTGVVGAGEGVQIHFPDRRNDHEVELAVVIGKGGKGISVASAMEHVAGYCIGLDITIRGPEDRSFRKSPDTYTVLGPYLVTAEEIAEPGALDFSITVNGEPRQAANTRDLLVDIPHLIERASAIYTLYPGDVILTGTPEGVSQIKAGDTMQARIAQIGSMSVKVR